MAGVGWAIGCIPSFSLVFNLFIDRLSILEKQDVGMQRTGEGNGAIANPINTYRWPQLAMRKHRACLSLHEKPNETRELSLGVLTWHGMQNQPTK